MTGARRARRAMVGLLVVAMLAVACTHGDDAEAPPDTEPAPTTTGAADAVAEPVAVDRPDPRRGARRQPGGAGPVTVQDVRSLG